MLFSRYHSALESLRFVLKPAIAFDIWTTLTVKWIGWGVAGVALVLGVVTGAAFVQGLNIHRQVEITAHRGSKVRAPENTLSALRQAIDEGADYAEIDVQTTADGVVVLFHDADLMRVASVNRRLHRRGRAVHVWTVNDFNNVISMLEVGVDNIITDYPRDVRRCLETWNALSGSEKIVLMLRNLIVGLEGPEPSEL